MRLLIISLIWCLYSSTLNAQQYDPSHIQSYNSSKPEQFTFPIKATYLYNGVEFNKYEASNVHQITIIAQDDRIDFTIYFGTDRSRYLFNTNNLIRMENGGLAYYNNNFTMIILYTNYIYFIKRGKDGTEIKSKFIIDHNK